MVFSRKTYRGEEIINFTLVDCYMYVLGCRPTVWNTYYISSVREETQQASKREDCEVIITSMRILNHTHFMHLCYLSDFEP
jgi:hypothetical protein